MGLAWGTCLIYATWVRGAQWFFRLFFLHKQIFWPRDWLVAFSTLLTSRYMYMAVHTLLVVQPAGGGYGICSLVPRGKCSMVPEHSKVTVELMFPDMDPCSPSWISYWIWGEHELLHWKFVSEANMDLQGGTWLVFPLSWPIRSEDFAPKEYKGACLFQGQGVQWARYAGAASMRDYPRWWTWPCRTMSGTRLCFCMTTPRHQVRYVHWSFVRFVIENIQNLRLLRGDSQGSNSSNSVCSLTYPKVPKARKIALFEPTLLVALHWRTFFLGSFPLTLSAATFGCHLFI